MMSQKAFSLSACAVVIPSRAACADAIVAPRGVQRLPTSFSTSPGRSRTITIVNTMIRTITAPIQANPARHPAAAMRAVTGRTDTIAPKLFPAVTNPIIRPRVFANQSVTSRPAGRFVTPAVPAKMIALNR